METLWFCLVAVMITMYVVLDGYDLGAGIIHLLVARTDPERRQILRSIGPVWDGNEVWLLAGGGTLYFAFPALYASSFSGFYLPLMIVLWLLILRGISIEFRNHIQGVIWSPAWDAVFGGASAMLAIFFGAALGNVVRGVPLDSTGYFFLPLWTNFNVGFNAGILDWYTVTTGLAAFSVLTMHGALWVSYKTVGAIEERSGFLARRVWWVVGLLTMAITVMSFSIQPQISRSFGERPWGYIFPAIALAGFFGIRFLGDSLKRFLASSVYILGMLTSAAFGVYPYVLPSNGDPALGLTVHNAAAAPYGLKVGLAWFIPGILLALGYVTFVHLKFAGKVNLEEEGY